MELFQYSTITPKIIENLSVGQIYFNVVNKVNDPYEGIFNFDVHEELKESFVKFFYRENYNKEQFDKVPFDDIKRQIIFDNTNTFLHNSGVSCFTEDNTSLLMWGNYANKHTGICVGYNSEVSIFKEARKVSYSDTVYTISIKSEDDLNERSILKHGVKFLFNKYSKWDYEKEWRIIFKPCETCSYEKEAITSINFGLKTSYEDIMKVIEATKGYNNLKYYRTTLNPHSYEIISLEL